MLKSWPSLAQSVVRGKTIFNALKKVAFTAASLLPPFVLLSLALGGDGYVLDWPRALELMCIAGVIGGLVMQSLRRMVKTLHALLIVPAVFFGASIPLFSNQILDKSVPAVSQTSITEKHIVSGRYGGSYLTIAPWEANSHASTISVTRDRYSSLSAGQRICIYLYPGALGIRWYRVNLCE